ncbi:MAG TPA: SsrA-binding protein SmpB [Desulfurobacteriaceae bacterium]|nr:SsrA-binding protein SmpB [Desulfurobacteriaceae bacterium]
MKIVAENRKAYHDYEILETIEAGMVLEGTEVKSLSQGKCQLKDGYAKIKDGEVYLVNVYIAPYDKGTHKNHDPLRERKLLLHKYEIKRLIGKLEEKGLTLIPLKIYFKNRKAKVLLGLARGRKKYEKRHVIKEREVKREIERYMKSYR